MTKIELIKVHISGFGSYQNADIEFNEHLNSYCENNGFGKSTLMDFIKVMFYGMDTVKTTDKDYKERTHYSPLARGTYGGSLDFKVSDEYGSHSYHIERSFDEKTATKDSLTLKGDKINAKKEEAQEEINKLMGVSKETYLKTLYISNEPLHEDKNLKAILTDTIHNQNANNYDTILKRLDKEISENNRKVNNLNDDLKGKQLWLDSHKDIESDLEQCIKDKEVLNNKKLDLTNEQKQATQQSFINETAYAQKKLLDLNQEVTTLKGLYPYGYPSKELMGIIKEKEDEKSGYEKSILNPLNVYEQERKETLSVFIKSYSQEEYQDDKESLMRLEGQCQSNALSSEEKRLLSQYSYLTENDVTRIESTYKSTKIDNYNDTNISAKKNSKAPLIISIISSVMIITGLVLGLLKVASPLGWVLLGTGVFGIILAMFVFLYARTENNTRSVKLPQDTVFKALITSLNLGISYQDADSAYQEWRLKYKEYQDAREKAERINNINHSYQELNKSIDERLQGYDYNEVLREYNALEQKDKVYQESLKTKQTSLLELNKNLEALYLNNHLDMTKDSYALQRDYDSYLSKLKEQSEALKQYESLKKKYNLKDEEIVSKDIRNIDSINKDLDEINDRIMGLVNQQKDLEADQKQKNQLERECHEIEIERDDLAHKKAIADTTKACFEAANQNLSDSFIIPIQKAFKEKINELSEALDGYIEINDNLEFVLHKKGQQLCFNQLSSGEAVIVCLALRLCVIETVFKGNKPFIVLDDPFMSLDHVTLDKAINLVKKLDQQVLYFTCHESRIIK